MTESNGLRMSFAEWLHRMSAADVPYQARTLAIYAAVFDITGNEELSTLSGLEGRTFDRWKKYLADEGWVRIDGHRNGGRGLGIEVNPAIDHVPITFTDVSPRNPRKFCAPIGEETPAIIAPLSAPETPAILTPLSVQTPVKIAPLSAETPAEITGVTAPPRARGVYKITKPIQEDSSKIITTVEQAERGLQGERATLKRAAPRVKPTPAQFERFWNAYPLRKGKAKALEKFLALTPDQAERSIIAAHAYAMECETEAREAQFIKWPQGWLGDRRFDDDQVDPHEALRGPGGERWGWWRGKEDTLRGLPLERWRDAVKSLKPNGVWPWWKLTAPPGHKECLMPAALITEYGYEEIYKGQITHG